MTRTILNEILSLFGRRDLVLLVPIIGYFVGVFIHEYAHIIVAMNLGIRIDSVTFSVLEGAKVWVNIEGVDVTIGGLLMLGFIGGIIEGIFYAVMTLKVREMSVMALGSLTYGVAESFRVALRQPDFIMFKFARWFLLFTMLVTVLLIGRRHYRMCLYDN